MKKTGVKKLGKKRFETVSFKRAIKHNAKENVACVGTPTKPMSQRYFKPKKDTYTPRKY